MAKKSNPENLLVIVKWQLKKMIGEVKLIGEIAKDQQLKNTYPNFVKRQSTDIIDHCINDTQSMFKREQNGFNKIVYREDCFVTNEFVDKSKVNKLKKDEMTHIEHVIPKADFHHHIFEIIENNPSSLELMRETVKAFLSPVAMINRRHIKKNNPLKIKHISHNEDIQHPFKRYNDAGIKIFTYRGQPVDNDTRSIDNHWELLRGVPEFKEIMDAFGI